MAVVWLVSLAVHARADDATDAGEGGTTAAAPEVELPKAGGLTGLPVITFAPETSVLFAGVGVYLFDVGANGHTEDGEEPARKSSINLLAAYTLKNQVAVALTPSVYLDGEAWRLYGTTQAVIYPDRFYALGQDSPDAYEDYGQRILLLRGGFERQVFSKVRVGAKGQVAHATVTNTKAGGLLASYTVPGSRGGLVVGLGPTLAWDNRDRDTATHRGGRHAFTLLTFTDVLGSEYNFIQGTLRLRHFFTLWGEHVLGLEAFGQLTQGDAPFQLMSQLGGNERMRGYFGGRYRDLHQVMGQVEYRMPVWWRFGLAGFVGAGDVAHAVTDFRYDDPKVAGGLGLRIALSQADKVNLRVDVAMNRDGESNLYVSLGEAF